MWYSFVNFGPRMVVTYVETLATYSFSGEWLPLNCSVVSCVWEHDDSNLSLLSLELGMLEPNRLGVQSILLSLLKIPLFG